MKLCRFKNSRQEIHIGLELEEDNVLDLAPAGIRELHPLFENEDFVEQLSQLAKLNLPRISVAEMRLCAPVERQEVWAAGVTYLRSKKARMEESDFSATAYDRVYLAERPEIFFKSLGEKIVPPPATRLVSGRIPDGTCQNRSSHWC
jgi:2-dehydro-3-deoxy-D-arabinonate dehydratase